MKHDTRREAGTGATELGRDTAEGVILLLWNKHYPDDQRQQNALNAAREWLLVAIKLSPAKKVIFDCHAAAREAYGNSVAQAAARAIGQCASTQLE